MIVLDARVLIAHFDANDAHHVAARRLLRESVLEELTVHPVTLAELLVGPAKRGRELDRLRDLRSLGITPWHPGDDDPLRIAQLRARTGLKVPDACVLSAAIESLGALATFDVALTAAALDLRIRTLPH